MYYIDKHIKFFKSLKHFGNWVENLALNLGKIKSQFT